MVGEPDSGADDDEQSERREIGERPPPAITAGENEVGANNPKRGRIEDVRRASPKQVLHDNSDRGGSNRDVPRLLGAQNQSDNHASQQSTGLEGYLSFEVPDDNHIDDDGGNGRTEQGRNRGLETLGGGSDRGDQRENDDQIALRRLKELPQPA